MKNSYWIGFAALIVVVIVIYTYIAYNQMFGTRIQQVEEKNPGEFAASAEQQECEEAGGVWESVGARPVEECNFPTSDAGEPCSDSNECEGSCINGDPETNTGECSEWTVVVGCHSFVEEGVTQPVVCYE